MDPTELHQVAEVCERVAAVASQLAEARQRVAKLSAERRNLLGSLRGRGLSVTQIAELTGLSRGQVANEMARSLQEPAKAPAKAPAKKSPPKKKGGPR